MAVTLPVPDLHADPADRNDLRPRRHGGALIAAVVIAALAGAAAWFWWQRASVPEAQQPVTASAPAPVAETTPAPEPTVRAPLPAPAESEAVPPAGLSASVQELLGPASAYLVSEGLARRIVATIDQLGREHAPPSMWPVTPTPGHFLVDEAGAQPVIAAANAQRYAAMVDALAAIDPAAVAALYRRAYPVLDGAWRELGMGSHPLHDRVIAVVELLLRTPEPAGPVAVRLTEVKGPIPSTRPWLRYEFADPQLEALPAGQKILLRMAPPEREKLRRSLRALRQHLVAGK